eukprot:Clim_evm36s239 gene=Clim_evmTU36s239
MSMDEEPVVYLVNGDNEENLEPLSHTKNPKPVSKGCARSSLPPACFSEGPPQDRMPFGTMTATSCQMTINKFWAMSKQKGDNETQVPSDIEELASASYIDSETISTVDNTPREEDVSWVEDERHVEEEQTVEIENMDTGTEVRPGMDQSEVASVARGNEEEKKESEETMEGGDEKMIRNGSFERLHDCIVSPATTKETPEQRTRRVSFDRHALVLHSVEIGFHDEVKSMLENIECVNQPRRANGMTLLHVAVMNGDLNVVMLLLERGADVNARDDEDWTSLHLAVDSDERHSVAILDLLLEKGADLLAETDEGQNVFDMVESEEMRTRLDAVADAFRTSDELTAIYDYEPQEADEVLIRAGDKLTVLNRITDSEGWWHVKSSDGAQGLAPANYLTAVLKSDVVNS